MQLAPAKHLYVGWKRRVMMVMGHGLDLKTQL